MCPPRALSLSLFYICINWKVVIDAKTGAVKKWVTVNKPGALTADSNGNIYVVEASLIDYVTSVSLARPLLRVACTVLDAQTSVDLNGSTANV